MTTAERTQTSLRRRAVLAMAVSAIGFAGAAKAQGAADLVDLTVVDRATGQPLRVWRHSGRLFVAGRPGGRYSLRVTNSSGGRVLVVMSVDGVNVLTGETANYGQPGYVFDPFQSYDVSGWRKSDTEVAAFTFSALPNSYAARTGRPFDVGVIGIAAFKERAVTPAAPPAAISRPRSHDNSDTEISELVVGGSRTAPAPAPAEEVVVTAQKREEKLGTAHGARERSEVTSVAFERATRYPQLIRRIEYDTYANLVASGVIRAPSDPGRRPRPFPSQGGGAGYVPDPPAWP